MASKPIYQIYAELVEYKPKIWRRFQVMEDVTMAKLAYILMTLFEMQGSHLYQFKVNELDNFIRNNLEFYNKSRHVFKDEFFKIGQYGCIFDDDDIIDLGDKRYRKLQDAQNIKMKHVLEKENVTAEFKYDFGDGWILNVIVEKIFDDKTILGKDLPRVLEGEGFGIVEDCGGICSLEDIRKAFETKKGEDYEMYSQWMGKEEFDLEKCDLEDLNFRLKKLPRIFKESYEYYMEPSEKSIKILERDYKNK